MSDRQGAVIGVGEDGEGKDLAPLRVRQRQARPAPHEAQEQLALVVGERVERLPEVADRGIAVGVPAAELGVALQRINVDDRVA